MKQLTLLLAILCLGAAACSNSTTVSISSKCGSDVVSADPYDVEHREQVAVHVQLSNALQLSIPGTLRVTLTPAPEATDRIVKEQQGVLPPGALEGDVWFPISDVSLAEHVLVELVPNGQVDPTVRAEQDLRFECVSACPANHVIVELPELVTDCGVLRKLNGTGTWQGALAAVGVDRSYCNYDWHPVDVPAPQPAPAPDLHLFDGSNWQVDCPVVVPQQSVTVPPPTPTDPLTPQDFAYATERRLGIDQLNGTRTTPPTAAAWPSSNVRKVWLGIVDTAAHVFSDGLTFRDVGRDNSEHGRLMGLIAHRTACGLDQNCPVEIHNQLALSSLAPEGPRDVNNGGYLGTRGELAGALHQLLLDWQVAASVSDTRLVINLSLGWHSKHDCGPPAAGLPVPPPDPVMAEYCGRPLQDDVPSLVPVPAGMGFDPGGDFESQSLGTKAVLLEVTRARCLGALVFAASGNAIGGDDTGAILPAAWNQLSLRGSQCPKLLGLPEGEPIETLVSAVGGVDTAGQPLALTRRNAQPRLVAFGSGLSALDAEDQHFAKAGWSAVAGPLSGTSLATSVVSGAAARLWADVPGIASPAYVEEALFRNGEDTRATPELCPRLLPCAKAGETIHEVTACTPFVALGLPNSCSIDRTLPINPATTTASNAAPNAGVTCLTPEIQEPRDAGPGDPLAPSSSALPLCPELTDPRVDVYEAPWVFPQPWGVRCATCSQQITKLSSLLKQNSIALTDAEVFNPKSTLTAARIRAGSFVAGIGPIYFNKTSTALSTSATGPIVLWPYSTQTPAVLDVDATLHGTTMLGLQPTDIPQSQ